MSKQILVTGGTGFIGSHTVVELQNNGYDVVIVDNLSNSKIEVLEQIEAITGVKPKFEEFDLTDKQKVNDFFQKSAFGKQQLISFYYGAFVDVEQVPVSNHSVPLSEDGEKFRWVKLSDLSEDLVTFPIDKHVVSMLKEIEL